MKVLVVGGSGLIGSRLVKLLRDRGDVVVVTGRSEARLKRQFGGGAACVVWDPASGPLPAGALRDVDAVVNLAGDPVHKGRWSKAKKKRIRESRTETTRLIVAGLEEADPKPRAFVSASAIGYYGDTKHNLVTESAPPAKGDFLADVCVAWEEEAAHARAIGVRTAIVRVGVVLAREGGAYPEMARPFRFFAGGQIGLGKAWMSWIHIDDVAGLFAHCVHDDNANGAYNATAPYPVSNGEFSSTLGEVLHRPVPFAVPAFVLRVIKGEFARVITASTRVRPLRTLALGYEFKFPRLRAALLDLEGKAPPPAPQPEPAQPASA